MNKEFPHPISNLLPRRGFTSIEATEFLHQHFSQVPQWTCWYAGQSFGSYALRNLVGKDYKTEGKLGRWSWKRVPCKYPTPAYWYRDSANLDEGDRWVGMIEVQHADGRKFFLFSFLCSTGSVGAVYFASTLDIALLQAFADDVFKYFNPSPKDSLTITVYGGQPLQLAPEEDERIFLPPRLLEDIELQVFAFFDESEAYRRLRIRHRRGFLFVGSPGTGKTMMLRRLIRRCHQLFKPSFCMLRICRETREDDLDGLFSFALEHAPAMIILEDMDSLTKETMVTRSSLLAQLDGVANKEGLLIIGTTNNAKEIDPALIHRPGRFDRVWHFPLPDDAMRLEYLETSFKELKADTIQSLAQRTSGWSVAYLKELWTTAALTALGQNFPEVTEDALLEAFDLLESQFQAGRKHHAVDPRQSSVGFCGK